MTSNGAAPAPCDDRGEGRVADRLGGAISNLPSPSIHASQHIDLRQVFLALDNASPLLVLRAQLPDSCRHCGSKIATIVCGRRTTCRRVEVSDLRLALRGRLSKSTTDALTKVVKLFWRADDAHHRSAQSWRRARSHRGRAEDVKPTIMKITHTVTNDSPDGQPWPPTERNDVLWKLLRRTDDCSYWRAIELTESDPLPRTYAISLGRNRN